ncbi:MAG: hypothetical protein WCF30_09600 [Terracidiphilus sp.]
MIAIYFGMVIWIGFYLKGRSNTSEEFFMTGREMTAWIAGLSFVSANLGSLELMGWTLPARGTLRAFSRGKGTDTLNLGQGLAPQSRISLAVLMALCTWQYCDVLRRPANSASL